MVAWGDSTFVLVTHYNDDHYTAAPYSLFRYRDVLDADVPAYVADGTMDQFVDSVLDPSPLLDADGLPLKVVSMLKQDDKRTWILARNPQTGDGGVLAYFIQNDIDSRREGTIDTKVIMADPINDPSTVLNMVGRFECGRDGTSTFPSYVVYVLTTADIRAYSADSLS